MNDRKKQPQQLLIGWSSTSITPDKPVQLHGQHYERVSEYVRDPVTATVLAFETVADDGAIEQAIMVSCDLVNMPREVVEELRGCVAPRLTGFDARKLFLNATHTHTGPTMMEGLYPPAREGVMKPAEYAKFFISQIADAIVAAWESRKLGGISWALGHAAVGFNRRVVYDDGTAKMYGTSDTEHFMGVEGTNDHGVEILFTWDAAGEMTGVMINLACPSQVVEGQYYVSADFWAAVRDNLREIFSGNPFVYPMVSAAGDQSPRDLVRRGRGEVNMRDDTGLEEMGRRISNAVEYAYRTARSEPVTEVVFEHHIEELSLPMRRATVAEAEEAQRGYDELMAKAPVDPYSLDGGWLRRYQAVVERYAQQGDDPRYSMALHVIRLGEIAIAVNPFELYLDYGLRMKARSKAHQTFVVQLCDDRGKYLPTRKAVAHGHYGGMIYDNTVGPEGGELLVERTVNLINAMWAEDSQDE